MIRVQIADSYRKRIIAGSENLSRAESAIAFAEENGGIAIIIHAGVSHTNHDEIGFAVAVEITCRDASRVFSCGELRRRLEASITIPQQNTHASVVTHAGVPEA